MHVCMHVSVCACMVEREGGKGGGGGGGGEREREKEREREFVCELSFLPPTHSLTCLSIPISPFPHKESILLSVKYLIRDMKLQWSVNHHMFLQRDQVSGRFGIVVAFS